MSRKYCNAQWFASNALEALTKYNWHRSGLSAEEQIESVKFIVNVLCDPKSKFEGFVLERLASAAVYGLVRCYPDSSAFVKNVIVENIVNIQQQVANITSTTTKTGHAGMTTEAPEVDVGVLYLWKNVIEECFGSNSYSNFRSKSLAAQLKGFRLEIERIAQDVMTVLMNCVCKLWDNNSKKFRCEFSVSCMLNAVRVIMSATMSQGVNKCFAPSQASQLIQAAKMYSNASRCQGSETPIADSLYSLTIECAGIEGTHPGVEEMLCEVLENLSKWCSEVNDSIATQNEENVICLFESTDALVTKQLTRIERDANLSNFLGTLLSEVLLLTRKAAATKDVDLEVFKRCVSFWENLVSHLLVAAESVEEGGVIAKTDGASRCGALAAFLQSGLLQLAELLIHSLFFCGTCVHLSKFCTFPDGDSHPSQQYTIIDCIEANFDVKHVMRSELWEHQQSLLDIISSLVYVYGEALVPICLVASSAGGASAQQNLTHCSVQDMAMSMMLLNSISGLQNFSTENLQNIDNLLQSSISIFQCVHKLEVCNHVEWLQAVKHLAVSIGIVHKSFSGHLAPYWITSSDRNPISLNNRLTSVIGCLIQCACSSILDENCHMAACAALRGCILSWRFEAKIIDFQATLNITSALRQECLGSETTRERLSIESEALLWACTAEGLFTFPSIKSTMNAEVMPQMISIASSWTSNLISPIVDAASSESSKFDERSASRATRIVCALLATCCGASKEYKHILYQSLFRHTFTDLHKILIKLVSMTQKSVSFEPSIMCFILSCHYNFIRNFRQEVGSLMKEYVQDMINYFLRESATYVDLKVWHLVLQFLSCLNKDMSSIGSSLIPSILIICERSLLQSSQVNQDPQRHISKDASKIHADICDLALTIPIEIILKHWRIILKLSETGAFDLQLILRRTIHLALVTQPHPPPCTVKAVMSLLKQLFTIHKKINLKEEEDSITTSILMALVSGHFDSFGDELVDVLLSITIRNEGAWEQFTRQALPSLSSACNERGPINQVLLNMQALSSQDPDLESHIFNFICTYKLCI